MEVEDIRELIALGEGEALEFKQTTGQRTRAMETLCGMLNGKGGSVVFGVNDTGKIIGQKVSAATLRQLQVELARIQPSPFADVECVTVGDDGLQVVVVTVPGRTGVYTFDGRAFVRRGATTTRMAKEQYEQLLLEQSHGARRWEKLSATEATIEELDIAEIIRTVDEAVRRDRLEDPGTRDAHELLLGMGLVKDGQLLNAAVVLFGKPEIFPASYSQCLLKMARFAGTDKDEFLDNRQEYGNAFALFIRAQRFLRDHLPVASHFSDDSFERTDVPALPTAAIRETLANAICHRDYSSGAGSLDVALYEDRLEISNTGTLHFGMTAEDLGRIHKSMPWNPLIAQAFYRRGIIETWGRGTLKIRNLMKDAGLPSPEFEITEQTVTVRFFLSGDKSSQPQSRPQSQPQSQPQSEKQLRNQIISLLQDGALSTSEISSALGQQQRSGHLRKTLRELHKEGVLEFTLPDKPSSRMQKHRVVGKEDV